MIALVLQHHPHSALTDLRGKRWSSFRHGSILARVGASGKPGAVHTLYIGVTNNLARRVHEHRSRHSPSFTATYGVTRLVWYESYDRIIEAIEREKALKKWRRDWKIRLIEEMNPDWSDLYGTLAGWTG